MTWKGLLRITWGCRSRRFLNLTNVWKENATLSLVFRLEEKEKHSQMPEFASVLLLLLLFFFFFFSSSFLFSKILQTGVLIASYQTKRTIHEGEAGRNVKGMVEATPYVTARNLFLLITF